MEKGAKVRVMFMDEASFGRISEPSCCWCPIGVRPVVPHQRVREYVYAYGAVDPVNGDDYFIIAPNCNTAWTSEFLKALSIEFPNDFLLICTDNASWHKSKKLIIPGNMHIHFLPPYTPEMNPTEQIWIEARKDGFKNTLFNSLSNVVDKLSITLNSFSHELIKSVCGREWIVSMFERK